jgi:Tfp pilus assembly protein PilP
MSVNEKTLIALLVFNALLLCGVSQPNGLVAAQPGQSAQQAGADKDLKQKGNEIVTIPPEEREFTLKTVKQIPYTAGNRRDPFVSIISLEKQKMATHKKSKNPLENFDVSDFKLLGIIYDGKHYYASVTLPDQKAYTLKAGMKVGLYGGKVDSLTQDKVVVKEYVTDFMGNLKPRYSELKLRKEEEK